MLKAAAALFALGFAAPGVAAGPEEEFDAFLADFRTQERIPALSVTVLKDGEALFEKAYGVADDEGEVEATPDTTFFVASVTKPIAATAIVAEAAKGGLRLDLPLHTDDGWADRCEWLSHSSIPFGGGDDTLPATSCSEDMTLAHLLNMRVNGDGSRSVYNPIAYAWIDRVIEAGGGRPLREIMRENVVEAAGMEHVALGWRDEEAGLAHQRLAPPFKSTPEGPEKAALPDDDLRAAAGLYASTRQIAAFDRAFDRGKLLPEGWAEALYGAPVGEPGDYRYGWWVQEIEGKRAMWHGGWEPDKYSALYLKLPQQGLTLIALANTEAIYWGNPLDRAEVEKSVIAAKFIELFAQR